MTDPHWLVKDFHVLYRVANQFVQRMHGVRDEAAQNALDGLVAQLERLRPAFETCEAERRASAPVPFVLRGAVPVTTERAAARFLEVSGLVDVPAQPAQRPTEPERKALNALHRWLHSPGGDGMLTDEAQDYHDQVEAECAEDCARLEEEERLAWGTAMRGADEAPTEPGT